jgi:type VI secretion system protein ImpH
VGSCDGGQAGPVAGSFTRAFVAKRTLPLHLTEYARDRARNADDPTLARFLDIFHHRTLSLFYRAWANSRPTLSFDRPQADRFAAFLGALGTALGCSLPVAWPPSLATPKAWQPCCTGPLASR